MLFPKVLRKLNPVDLNKLYQLTLSIFLRMIGGTLLIGSGLLTTIIALKDKDREPDINTE